MPVRFAVTSSAWSSGSTWDNGAVPIAGDDVYANGYNITIDQNINIVRITNQASPVRVPNIATPAMTSDTTPAGTGIVFSGGAGGNAPAWRAFDQTDSLFWQSNVSNTGIIGYQFTIGKIIKQYAFQAWSANAFNPTAWTFQGSNDGVSYTTLETVTGFIPVANTWYVRNISSNTTSYTYYRMNITAVSAAGSAPVIRELQMTESTGSVYGAIGSGSFISGGDIQISASAQYGIESSGGTTPPGLACFVITGSHFVGITGSILGPNAGFSMNRHGVLITNGGTASIIGDVFGANAGGGSSGVFGLYVLTGSAFITGSLRTINNGGNTAGSPLRINNGTASISGTLISTSQNAPIFMGAGNAQVNFNGNVIITGTSNGNMQVGIESGQIGTLNYNGPVIGNNNAGIGVGGAATVNVTGSVSTIGAAAGISSTVASTINVNGPITANNSAPGLSSTSTAATVRVTGPLIASQNNINPIFSPKIQLISTSTPTYTLQSDTFLRNVTFYDVAFTSSLPAQTNVRSGSLYGGSNQFSGSMVVPSTGSVRYGVPVDNVTGSAILTPQDILDYAVSSLTGSNSIGARLQNIATTQTTAATIAAFKGK
jgi:hypothetical protein